MCNYLLKNGIHCKIKTKNNYCWMHKNSNQGHVALVKKNENLKELNNKLINIINEFKQKIETLENKNKNYKIEIINKDKLLKQHRNNFSELINEIENLKELNENMKIDYNNYQIIKKFEIEKNNLSIEEYNKRRIERNKIAHPQLIN